MENSSSPNHSDYKPKFYSLLSDEDKAKYTKLRSTLSSHAMRNRRGKRVETFAEMLSAVQSFCIRGDADDWKRCVVCGVCWLSNGIAINNRQLGLLIDKCKSSINGSLQKMGYSTIQNRSDSNRPLIDAIPFLKNNFAELREWTVRYFQAATPQPNLPLYNVSTIFPFSSPAPQRAQCYNYPCNPSCGQPCPQTSGYMLGSQMPLNVMGMPYSQASVSNIMQPNMVSNIPSNYQPNITSNIQPSMSNLTYPNANQPMNIASPPQAQQNNSSSMQIYSQPNNIGNQASDQQSTLLQEPTQQAQDQGQQLTDDQQNDPFFDDPFLLAPDFLMDGDDGQSGDMFGSGFDM
ncbi:potassium/sodium hyperpolarization-activated cyclic nucleotide-gated channel 1 [Tritrichomonas foetus]|uniref:Potassium/sodium hyperpolarization-activated cyclic nucleotide-gated channel 1 n=1 Tax=Tritrichomonas foetus TaxID=1144522 RepID=A0A1J4J752_9EUKA|nr:potassium/sodium hyperpolarization-activated cyclic nucleotide-gated channel 1 [Tritrichomonas foetus]|eukprot:OHS93028.1 potassium/sodium hyperpolarization-activated cyclic nucleotide-gated channel 1 [Tritrichomonas foetus]